MILTGRPPRLAAPFLVVAAALFAIPALARAETAADADAAISKGIELRRQGHDREALAEFERAAAIQKTPRVTAQIGFAEQALGLWVRAESHLQQALTDRNDPWIERNANTIENALKFIQGHLGSVEVWGTPAGAEVLLDGQVVGTLPMDRPVRVTNSEVTLQVRAKGHASITRTLQVPRGRYSVREQVDLHPLTAEPPSVVVAAPPDAPRPAALDLRSHPTEPSPAQDATPIYRKTWFWVVIGAGVAAAAGAAIVIASSHTSYPPVQSTGTFDNGSK